MTVSIGSVLADPFGSVEVAASVLAEDPDGFEKLLRLVRVQLDDAVDAARWEGAVRATVDAKAPEAGGARMSHGGHGEVAMWLCRALARDGAIAHDLGEFWRAGADGLWRKVELAEVYNTLVDLEGTPVFVSEKEVDGQVEVKTRPYKVAAIEPVIKLARAHPTRSGQGSGFFSEAPQGLAVGNVFLRVDWTHGEIEEVPLAHHHRQRFGFEFDYIEGARAPKFEAYLRSAFGDEAEDVGRLLQEWVGAALFGLATRYHRALAIQGVGGTGKSTFINIVEGMFPPGSVCHVKPGDWDNDNKLGLIMGAKLNTMAEAQGAILGQAQVKGVVMGEPQTVDLKYEKGATFSPEAAHLFAFNVFPAVPGADRAFWDRWLVLAMERRVRDTGEEVRDLAKEILAEELPGLVAWAVEGAHRVLEQDGYSECGHAARHLERWKSEADALSQWLAESVDVGGNVWTQLSRLHMSFGLWAHDEGKSKMGKSKMSQRLVERGLEIKHDRDKKASFRCSLRVESSTKRGWRS